MAAVKITTSKYLDMIYKNSSAPGLILSSPSYSLTYTHILIYQYISYTHTHIQYITDR